MTILRYEPGYHKNDFQTRPVWTELRAAGNVSLWAADSTDQRNTF
jgi:hypothetical protein